MSKSKVFKSTKAEERMADWYDRFLEKCPANTTSQTLKTRFGDNHVLFCGDSSKPPLLALHAMMTGSAHLLSLIHHLKDSFYLILPDIPGHSARGLQQRLHYKKNEHLEWMEDIVRELNLSAISLLGVSLGGYFAHQYASEYPEKIQKLALLVPAGIVQGSVIKGLASMFIPMIRYRMNPNRKNLEGFLEPIQSEWDDDWSPYMGDSFFDFKPDTNLPPVVSDEHLQNLNMPLLVIGGEKDISFPGEPMQQRINNLLPDADAEVLPDCKHCPPTSDAFNAELTNTLKEFYI